MSGRLPARDIRSGGRTGGRGGPIFRVSVLGLVANLTLAASFSLVAGVTGAAPAAAEAPVASVTGWLDTLTAPVEIGSWRFSPARLLAAALLFFTLVLLVRLLRRWLRRAFLNAEHMDAAAAHSIDKSIGYSGLALAVLGSLSVAGIDVSSFAIVAGALSLGIGFGLQSIVNNFVSGLILLAERPVKVGDWIEIKGQRGRVSAISVRATRIETGDRASVFVPNADLIANPLANLTPGGSRATAVVRVGVPHGSDPARVRAVLAEAAAACPLLARDPAPSVSFDDIGANALHVSVRGTVAGPEAVASAESEMRALIAPALHVSGIGVARPQSDVHLRDLDAVRAITLRMLEERERKARMEAAAPGPTPPNAPNA